MDVSGTVPLMFSLRLLLLRTNRPRSCMFSSFPSLFFYSFHFFFPFSLPFFIFFFFFFFLLTDQKGGRVKAEEIGRDCNWVLICFRYVQLLPSVDFQDIYIRCLVLFFYFSHPFTCFFFFYFLRYQKTFINPDIGVTIYVTSAFTVNNTIRLKNCFVIVKQLTIRSLNHLHVLRYNINDICLKGNDFKIDKS